MSGTNFEAYLLASSIGPCATEDGVRMLHNRFLKQYYIENSYEVIILRYLYM